MREYGHIKGFSRGSKRPDITNLVEKIIYSCLYHVNKHHLWRLTEGILFLMSWSSNTFVNEFISTFAGAMFFI